MLLKKKFMIQTWYVTSLRDLTTLPQLKFIVTNSVLLGFKKWPHNYKIFLFYLFFKLVSSDIRFVRLVPKLNLLYSNVFSDFFEIWLIQLCFWISMNNLRYKKDYFIYFLNNGFFFFIFDHLTFLKHLCLVPGTEFSMLQKFLDGLVFSVCFQMKVNKLKFVFFRDFNFFLRQFLFKRKR